LIYYLKVSASVKDMPDEDNWSPRFTFLPK